jgi:ubiquinone/menaquinone biosynthesis C-methylase UbiE
VDQFFTNISFCGILYFMFSISQGVPPTGRKLEAVLQFHDLPLQAFAGATVFDLGCGMSDLGAELAARGVEAEVTGFDQNPNAFISYGRTPSSTRPVTADLADLPAEDNSADIVLATYSVPMWGKDSQEIEDFFTESRRVTKPGGLLSIFPITAARRRYHFTETREARLAAAQTGARQIFESHDWVTLRYDTDAITARKLK